MASAKMQRTPVRAAFTKILNELGVKFNDEDKDLDEIERLFDMLRDRNTRLQILDDSVQVELINNVASTENDFTVEYEAVQRYRDQFLDANRTYRKLMEDVGKEETEAFETASAASSASSSRNSKKKYKLPKLEFTQFAGNPKEWLSFWNQFQSIHLDEEMAPQDKFQYLIQATKEGTKAREVVMSFPATADNYPKAIEYLKQRFGKDDVLIEVYVRDLLHLVIENSKRESKHISTLYDRLETQLRALESLGVTKDKFVAMLYPLVESCLPEEILKTWERTRHTDLTNQTDKLTRLMDFMRVEVETEDRVSLAKAITPKRTNISRAHRQEDDNVPTATDLVNTDQKNICVFCGKRHESRDCFSVAKMTLEEKRSKLRQKRACFSCLQTGHSSMTCHTKLQCPICQRKHVAMMCPELSHMRKDGDDGEKSSSNRTGDNDQADDNTTLSIMDKGPVLLQTLIIKIRNKRKTLTCRALIDTGSMRSYITKKASAILHLESSDTVELAHSLFGGTQTPTVAHRRFEICLSDLGDKNQRKIGVLESEKITGNVPSGRGGDWLRELENVGIKLSDIGEESREIHLLLGADIAGTLFTGDIYRTKHGVVAMKTTIGWTVMGPTYTQQNQANSSADSSMLVHTLHIKDADIQNLWKLDVLGITDPTETKSRDEITDSAVKYFKSTIKQQHNGRYEVGLPWLECHPPLAVNKEVCRKRLDSCLRKLRATGYMSQYKDIFDYWEKEGIIEKVLPIEGNTPCSYLPHRPVIKETSSTTPVRPVFDASCRSEGKASVNDCLERGPNLIELIPDIIIRFRAHFVGIVSDIAKAFLQIGIRNEDRDFLRFLWWEEATNQTVEYRHARVVFGVSSSPFLLAATINHHLDKIFNEDPEIVAILKTSFYVDNCVTSMETEVKAKRFIHTASRILKEAQFDLRGWEWTDYNKADKEISVLGMHWNTKSDTLRIDIRSVLRGVDEEKITKRTILSRVQRIFDPIGVCAPTTLLPKLMLQELWLRKRSWDEEIEGDIAARYIDWLKTVESLGSICIPRWLRLEESELSLHVFVDASNSAYAACAFVKSQDRTGTSIQLVGCKTRVAPTQKVDTSRLELLACLIGARLAKSVQKSLGKVVQTYFWTDSSNAFYWIQKNENWSVFIYNRVVEIRQLTKLDQWRHLPGDKNPADLPSRGVRAHKLVESRWWEGPEWLYKPAQEWPDSAIKIDLDVVNKERRKVVISSLALHGAPWYLKSSYRRILRLLAWILRWKKTKEARSGDLTLEEEAEAEFTLLKLIQKEFTQESLVVKHTKAIKGSDGIWRVSTKILMRDDLPDFRRPILISGDHPIVPILIRYIHYNNGHCGVQTLICKIRERFWITKTRQNARKIVAHCGICRRFTATRVNPVEAPLPEDRVKDAAVFESTGIDLGGPLYLKDGQKAWFVVFTCAVYRAVHLEVVTSSSTEAFLLSLRRFIARRGRPTTIYSDNGKNFEGAANLFEKIDWNKLQNNIEFAKIKWMFSPPSAPWWGGFWERVVGMVKKLLRRILGRACMELEELQTIMCDVEEIINSRPLTYVSEDVCDLTPLTPNSFLRDVSCGEVGDLDQCDALELNRRGKFRKEIREQLRRRFRSEYLGLLLHRYKKEKHSTVQLGEVVLIEDDLKKRINWKMGRILELIPGRDGVVRVARVKTAEGELLRPLRRLFPLECRDEVKEVGEGKFESSESSIIKTRSGRVVKKPARF